MKNTFGSCCWAPSRQDRNSGTGAVSAQPPRAERSGEEWNAPQTVWTLSIFFSPPYFVRRHLVSAGVFFCFFLFQTWALSEAPNLLFIGLIVKHGGGLGGTYAGCLAGDYAATRRSGCFQSGGRRRPTKSISFCLANSSRTCKRAKSLPVCV